jgi:hypothetical protein
MRVHPRINAALLRLSDGPMKTNTKVKVVPIASSESAAVTAAPLSFRADDAARFLGTTTFFIEEIMRAGELPFVVFGKRRVIFVTDLIGWAQKERTKQLAQQRIGVVASAA